MITAEPGDVLFGKLRPYLAKSWVVDRPVLASTELMCMRPNADLYTRFLGYLMNARSIVDWATATSDGTRMPRTSWDKFNEVRPWLPLRKMQKAIVDYLDRETARIDALIAKTRQLLELLRERRLLLGEKIVTDIRRTEQSVPLKRLVTESDHRYGSGPTPTILSVSIHQGVVPRDVNFDKESKADEFSRYKACTPGDYSNQQDACVSGRGWDSAPQRSRQS